MTTIKALSIARPWAELILRGKDAENRTWTTQHRGDFLIHASQKWDKDAVPFAQWIELGHDGYDFTDLSWKAADQPTGIVGIAELVDVCSAEVTGDGWPCQCGPWAMAGQRHWRLRNVRRLPRPVPCKGSLSLWTPPADVLAEVEAQYTDIEVAR